MQNRAWNTENFHGNPMKFRLDPWSTHRLEAQKRVALEGLKACPLCGAINAIQNHECFVCRWYGAFDLDPDLIEQGLEDLLDRCPELVEVMLENEPPRPTGWHRVRMFVARMLFPRRSRRALDYWI